jgi:hypothetical protein
MASKQNARFLGLENCADSQMARLSKTFVAHGMKDSMNKNLSRPKQSRSSNSA